MAEDLTSCRTRPTHPCLCVLSWSPGEVRFVVKTDSEMVAREPTRAGKGGGGGEKRYLRSNVDGGTGRKGRLKGISAGCSRW